MLSKPSGWHRVLIVSSIVWVIVGLINIDPWTRFGRLGEFLVFGIMPVILLCGIIWIVKGIVEPRPSEKGWIIENKKPIPVGPRTVKNILQDVKSIIPKLDERGSISFADLSKEKAEAVRRLSEDARRAGKSILDYAKEQGFDDIVAKGLDNLAREMALKVDMAKPSVGTEDFETGISENIGENMLSRLSVRYRILIIFSIVWIITLFIFCDVELRGEFWAGFLGFGILPIVLLWGIIWIVKGFRKNKKTT